jgi:S-adenosylmethionine decarboxylase
MHDLVSTHCILDLYGCPPDLLDDENYAREGIVIASRKSLSTLCTISSHKFSPHGVTAMGLLAESHISIHTWPEHGYVGVDVYTCGRSSKPQRACEFLADHFRARQKSLLVVPRGRDIQPQDLPLAEKLKK